MITVPDTGVPVEVIVPAVSVDPAVTATAERPVEFVAIVGAVVWFDVKWPFAPMVNTLSAPSFAAR